MYMYYGATRFSYILLDDKSNIHNNRTDLTLSYDSHNMQSATDFASISPLPRVGGIRLSPPSSRLPTA